MFYLTCRIYIFFKDMKVEGELFEMMREQVGGRGGKR
jgi:hypothetical protein